MNLTNLTAQQSFIINEVWILTFGGATQRNKIYKEGDSDIDKTAFRKELKYYIQSVILSRYANFVDEAQHIETLNSIIDVSKDHKDILVNGKLSIGTAQKLLNLSLKYYWCLGWIKEPPHFPIDRIIQLKLPKIVRKNWTEIDALEDYLSIIEAAKKELGKGETLAQWELKNFDRV